MATTISNTITNGIELGIASKNYPSPLTITTTGYINTATGYHGAAVYAANNTTLYLNNQGRIRITQVGGSGVEDGNNLGFSINNSGTITANGDGIYFTHTGPLNNSGTIISTASDGIGARAGGLQITNTGSGLISGYSNGINLNNGGTISNSGTIRQTSVFGYGIRVTGGTASVSNSGTIVGQGTATAAGGIKVTGGVVTVSNSGAIVGRVGINFSGTANQAVIDSGTIRGTGGIAIKFSSGNDLLQFTPSASVKIQGTVDGGNGTNTLEFTSAASPGTLTGIGADFVSFAKGTIDSGASWVFAGTNTIASSTTLTNSGTFTDTGTLVNAGTIAGAPANHLIMLGNGGYLQNLAGGVITGTGQHRDVSDAAGASVRISNAGSIGNVATSYYAIGLQGTIGDYVVNSGSITSNVGGIYMVRGTVVNSGVVTGHSGYAVGIGTGYLHNLAAGTIAAGALVKNGKAVNAGIITDSNGAGIEQTGSGTVINTGSISGKYNGVLLRVGGTVVNAGTIYGQNGTAVSFGTVGNDLLKLYAGATLIGVAAAVNSGNVLELGSSGTAGTISALGTNFTGFGKVQIDSGSQWTITGSNSLASGVTLTDLGTLTNAGTITGAGAFVVDPTTFTNSGYMSTPITLAGAGDVLTNTSTGTISVNGTAVYGNTASSAATVINAGTITGAGTAGVGVFLQAGSVANTGTAALISSNLVGVEFFAAVGTLTNAGTITAASNNAVDLAYGGSVANTGSAALISGNIAGVIVGSAAGTVTNAGTITGVTGAGVLLASGGRIANSGTAALISGARVGIIVGSAAGTVSNFGTIQGTGTA